MNTQFLQCFPQAGRSCLIAATDSEGESREIRCETLTKAAEIIAECMEPYHQGPPWQSAEVWANTPEWEPVLYVTQMNTPRTFQVIVPFHRRGKLRHVSYPASGHPHYTRDEAIKVLRVFEARRGKQYGTELECWAEGPGERFTLQDIDAPESIYQE